MFLHIDCLSLLLHQFTLVVPFSRRLMLCLFAFSFFFIRPPPISTLFPYTTLFRSCCTSRGRSRGSPSWGATRAARSEEHTSELQSRQYLVCRLLLEKKKKKIVF